MYSGKDGALVRALEGQESFQTMPLLEMNGWIVLSEHVGSIQAGELVNFYPSNPRGLPDIFLTYITRYAILSLKR